MSIKMNRTRKLFLIILAIGGGVILYLNPYLSPYVYLLNKEVIVFHTGYGSEYGGISLYRWGILTPLTPSDYYTAGSVVKRSPNEDKIAFNYWRRPFTTNWREGESDETYFVILDVKTHEITPIAYVNGHDTLSYQYPGEPYVVQFAWSPDGNRILYSMPVSKNYQELRLFDLQTGKSETTSIILDSMQGDKKVILDGLSWSPGSIPLVGVSYDDINPSIFSENRLFSIDSKFTQLTYMLEGEEAIWLSDEKTILYWCNVTSINTCTYSFETKQQQAHEIDLPYWQSTLDGLFVFARSGGGDGVWDKPSLYVYNELIHKVQLISPAFFDWYLFQGDFSVR